MAFTREDYALLRGGPDGIREWNKLRQCKDRKNVRPKLTHMSLGWLYLSGVDLRGADLSRTFLRGAILVGANLERADLEQADLVGADLEQANLSEVNLRGVELDQANLRGTNLRGVNLREVNLRGVNLRGAELERTDLKRTDLSGINLSEVNLNGADLRRADLSFAILGGAVLRGGILVGANLSAADLRRADLRSADLNNADLSAARLDRAVLSGANLSQADLGSAILRGANLNKVNLRNAILRDSDLSEVNLGVADLSWADLSRAKMHGSDLNRAIMFGVNLSQADMEFSSLRGALLSGCILNRALLIGVNLTDAVVDAADVTGIVIQELRGLPMPPSSLRVRRNRKEVMLTGDEAANFFVLPAVVEVYLTRELSVREIAGLEAHVALVHMEGEAATVSFVRPPRTDEAGTMLRFQGPTYEAVYAALPDLLAPFRTAAAIDWKATLDSIPKDDQPDALVKLVETALQDPRRRWPFAWKLAQVFDVFTHTEIRQTKEGGKGIVIKVATNKAKLRSLDPPPASPVTINTRGQSKIAFMNQGEGIDMGDEFKVKAGQVVGSAFGRGASVTAHDISLNVLNKAEASADQDWASVVKAALDALSAAKLPEADHAEAADTVGKIQAEAEKTDLDPARPGRIRRWLNSLSSLCKPTADLVAGAKLVITALGLGG